MRKSIKGGLAAVVAVMLLLGGYGTYALWNDTESLDGGAIEAGELKLDSPTEGVWADVSEGGAGEPIDDIATFLVVPGDILTYSLEATVLAKGENLAATLSADPASVTGDAELLAAMEIQTELVVNGAPATTITQANDGQTVGVTVTFTFDEASGNETQLQGLNLADLELVLQQNAR